METDRAGRFCIRFTCYAVGALALFLGGLIVLDTLVDFRPGAGQLVGAGVGVVLLGSGLLLIVRGPRALLSKEGEAALADELEKRVDREGLPTEPEAYQDGGLAVAATTETLPDAELLASVLKGEGIPAWVDGSLIASWGVWAYQSRSGVRVVVPLGRLADAEAVLAEHRRDEAQENPVDEETAEEERSEEESRTVRQAMALSAAAILVAQVGLYILFRAFRLSAAIAGARRRWWVSPALRRAHRWTLAAMLLATVSFIAWWGLLFPEIIRGCSR